MYNAKNLNKFIQSVNERAEQEAQKVFDSHREELLRRIKAQLHKNDVLYCANGAAIIDRDGENIRNEFCDIVAQLQYPIKLYPLSFLPDYETTKF